jgi:hypothetical protein
LTGSRREVRATRAFFEELDQQLGDERGPNGEPSSYDFQSHELLAIVERFADDWDRLPELIASRPDYRVLVGAGMVVRAFVVTAQLASDGAVELIGIEIDGLTPAGRAVSTLSTSVPLLSCSRSSNLHPFGLEAAGHPNDTNSQTDAP